MRNVLPRGFVAVGLLAFALPALALDFDLGGDLHLKMVNKLTAGAGIRTQGPLINALGKLNTPGQQTLCQNDDCLSFIPTTSPGGSAEPNQRLVDANGGYFLQASDDGDMNYDRFDPFTALVKLNADWTLNWGEWTFKTNFVGFYDAINTGFKIHRFNTVHCAGSDPSHNCSGLAGTGNPGSLSASGFDTYSLGDDQRRRSGDIEHRLAARGEFREYFVTHTFNVGDHQIFATLGNQRLRWGEANLTLLNTLDVINPQDAVLARQPGLALNELNLPTGLLNLGTDLAEGLSVDGWYQYKWDPVRPEPSGSFFSNLSDAAGGGNYAVIALGQYPEDPDQLWFSQGVTGLISNSSRTVAIPDERSHAPHNTGQYGVRAKWYLPNFNNGTELGFYYANYHSRLPYASVIATPNSCLRDASGFADAANRCNGFNAASNRGDAIATNQPERCDPRGCNFTEYMKREPLPIDRLGVFLDFPENIHMFGVSFNTTIAGWSVAGEYSYRPNLPAQVLLSDVVFAGLKPAIGRVNMPFTGVATFVPDPNADPATGGRVQALLADFAALQDPNNQNAVLPSADIIFPSYIADYRGYVNTDPARSIQGGQYIPGYERLKVGQFALTALQLFSTNPFGSDDLLMVYEVGFTNVFGMPKGIYFQGSPEQSHPSPGADCTGGVITSAPDGNGQDTTLVGQCNGRINPTQQTRGFADPFAWGVRALIQLNYSNLFDAGLTIKPTALLFYDVKGIAPSPMQNYVEGNRWLVPALMFEYGSDWSGSLIYQYFGGRDNALSDRDNISASITYAF